MKKNFKETTELLETLELYFNERETVNDEFIIEVFAIAGLNVVFTQTTFKFDFCGKKHSIRFKNGMDADKCLKSIAKKIDTFTAKETCDALMKDKDFMNEILSLDTPNPKFFI
ncbi:MAG: hypothetical protein J6W54_05600 [Fibrobacter sp.]|uniref:hypothetical protein n=1 Tax=Fibrobacter sp. TaxID=35828 RepID=UPI001B1023C6|nr:hypothetical protein [Fibrobacter sp.]MBO7060557.1 hypothetical protein [Fibrobacter sp.]